MDYGAKVRRARTALGLSQSDLAAISGINQGTISLLENGKAQPTKNQHQSLLKSLNLKDYGAKVRQARKAVNLSQSDLAEISGVHNTIISQIEKGRIEPTKSQREKLEKSLNLKDENHEYK